jgi:hypothetical protein
VKVVCGVERCADCVCDGVDSTHPMQAADTRKKRRILDYAQRR